MGNSLGRGRKAKVMKITGETFKIKTPAKARDVVHDYPGYVLLDSDAVKYFGIRAKPLEPEQELKRKKVYFLVQLPEFAAEKEPRTRRVRSGGIHMGARDRLECLMLSKRSVSDITAVARPWSGEQVSDGPAATGTGTARVKIRLPRAQVEKVMGENKDEVEVAAKILDLCRENSVDVTAVDGQRHVQWMPELASVAESLKPPKKRVSFVPGEEK
uniref:Plastid movement impaired protein n=1 Tax=Rhizophora mucronata TaxID=61149 RepID=A0A2P2JEN3_RHIMU